ncbi:hypothetical protein JW905_01185, partial [bacterium]|nr:hypothetical protein [candidate division CSSED10-310 bacterium]
MQIGQIVEFFDERITVCGMVIGFKGKKINVFIPPDREKSINMSRVIHASQGLLDAAAPRPVIAGELERRGRQRAELSETIQLEQLWEILSADGGAYTASFLADLWFGTEADDDRVAALVRVLYKDKVYFTT